MAPRLEFGSYMIPFEEKAIAEEDDCWTFSGYAAVFNNRDQGGDIIVPGAFKRTLVDDGLPELHVLHKHQGEPVGTITDAWEDSKGLRVEGVLPKDSLKARETYALLKPRGKHGARAYKGMSIGYWAVKSREGKHGGAETRFLEELKLKEASFVKDPMNRLAVVDQLKTDGLLTVDEFKSLSDGDREDHLRSLGLSQTWAKYLVKCTREAGTSRSSQREAGAVSADMPAFGDFLSALKATANR